MVELKMAREREITSGLEGSLGVALTSTTHQLLPRAEPQSP